MASQNEVVASARSWVGTPYRHQAATKHAGCDCLGLIVGVWRDLIDDIQFDLPPYSANWRDQTHAHELGKIAAKYLITQNCSPLKTGNVVLFNMRAGAAAKHCGIIVDSDHFIHAQERVGVVEVPFSNWWRRRIIAQFSFPERA
ncbi:NlpC/P60 family protein [Maritalea sp.]|uniref:NlpC/P60 family protein n=1 Tax=Maritalea sp. TaxID=2003361 RepID=UPI003EF81089